MTNVFKWLSVALVGLFLVSTLACTTYNVSITQPSSHDEDIRELYLKIALPTVLVRTDRGSGSGVVFGEGKYVLTAAHVIFDVETQLDNNGLPHDVFIELPTAIFKNEGLVPFVTGTKLVKVNHDLDLAILELAKTYPYGSASFAKEDPQLYEKCLVSGHPHGITDPMITEGRVQDLWEAGFIIYSAPSTFGNSGGPVWRLEGKRWVVSSVVQRVFVEGMRVAVNHMGLGALPSHVREFVRDVVAVPTVQKDVN